MNSKPSLTQPRKKFLALWGVAILGLFSILFLFNKTTQAIPTVTHFWIGSSGGNFSDGTKWSLSSGGTPCNCVPGAGDVAGFDGNANGFVTLDVQATLDSMYFMSGYTNTFNGTTNNMTITNDLYIASGASVKFGTGIWTISDDVIITVSNGVPTLSLSSATIFLGGDWNNAGGTIIPGTSTLSLNGAGLNQNILGSSTFYHLTVSPNNTKFVGFQEGTTTTILGTLTLTGFDADDKVHVQTVNAGGVAVAEQSTIVPSGSVSISNVTVQYNTNTGTPSPLTSLSAQVVEMVPFSTSGWFPVRGPGGVSSKLETWVLANAYADNVDISSNPVTNGNPVRVMNSVAGNTILNQADQSKQPVLQTDVFNFNPTFSFDGINDVLSSGDGWFSNGYHMVVKPATTATSNLTSNPSFFAPISWITSSTGLFPAGGFVIGGDFTGTLVKEIVTHAVGSAGGEGSMYRSAQLDNGGTPVIYESKPHIFSSLQNTVRNSQDIFANGKLISNGAYQTFIGFLDNPFNLGSYILDDGVGQSPCCFFEGQIPEIMSYNNFNTSTDRQKIESYLALKYGITMEFYNNERDYIASDGSFMWDDDDHPVANVYSHDIAGIGQDNASALYQPKSKSINTDNLITIGNPSDMQNLEFLVWGNNKLATDSWLTSPTVLVPKGYQALQRVWRIQETGDVGTVQVFIDQNVLPVSPAPVYLLVSSSPNFTSATPLRMIQVGGEWQLENFYNFGDGQYFMIATKVINIEFQDAIKSSPENTPEQMTNIFIQGEVLSPFSFSVTDTTASLANNIKATADSDYTFPNPQSITVPAGDYRTNVFAVPLNLSIIADNKVEQDEYTNFSISNLPVTGVRLGDITGDLVVTSAHTYIITNDDSVHVIVDPLEIDTAEGGSTSYTIVLSDPPRSGQTVVVDILFGSQLEFAESNGVVVGQATFTISNWDIPQVITVWAVEDLIYEGNHTDIITHSMNTNLTTDPSYILVGNIDTVTVTIWENDANPDAGDQNGGGAGTGSGFCLDPDGCDVPVMGCVDERAINYNPAANTASPSTPCLYILGETDPPTNPSNDYILEALSNSGECPYFSGFYKLGSEGSMVARWQAFLNVLLGTNLTVDGKFGTSTDIAVKEYHDQWKDIILRPWGHTTPTGYIYKTTNATGNSMIGCPLGTVFISETGEYFNADTYNSAYNLQELTNELRRALNIERAQLLDGYGNPLNDYTQN